MSKVIITYGRFNPPHLGHGYLFDTLKSIADDRQCPYYIFMSGNKDNSRNPLKFDDKLVIIEEMFPEHKAAIVDFPIMDITRTLKDLNSMGHNELIFVVDRERELDFEKMINDQNGKRFKFKKVEMIGLDRMPYSATEFRKAIREGNIELAKTFVPSSFPRDRFEELVRKV